MNRMLTSNTDTSAFWEDRTAPDQTGTLNSLLVKLLDSSSMSVTQTPRRQSINQSKDPAVVEEKVYMKKDQLKGKKV